MHGHPPSTGWSPTIQNLPGNNCHQLWMVTHQTHHPKEGHPSSIVWSPSFQLPKSIRRKCIAMDGQPPTPGCSPTITRMITHQPQDAHQPLEFGTKTHKVKTSRQLPCMVTHLPKEGHQPSKGQSLAFPRMVTNHPLDGHPSSKIWSPKFSKIVT